MSRIEEYMPLSWNSLESAGYNEETQRVMIYWGNKYDPQVLGELTINLDKDGFFFDKKEVAKHISISIEENRDPTAFWGLNFKPLMENPNYFIKKSPKKPSKTPIMKPKERISEASEVDLSRWFGEDPSEEVMMIEKGGLGFDPDEPSKKYDPSIAQQMQDAEVVNFARYIATIAIWVNKNQPGIFAKGKAESAFEFASTFERYSKTRKFMGLFRKAQIMYRGTDDGELLQDNYKKIMENFVNPIKSQGKTLGKLLPKKDDVMDDDDDDDDDDDVMEEEGDGEDFF